LNEFVNQRNNTNVMIVTVPHRHDLLATSCVNNEVWTFNSKLYKIIKNKDNVRILDHQTTRGDFTRHGLHLNATGKSKVVKLMSQNISQLFEVKKKYHIILKWRTTHNDPSLVDNIPKVINEDHVAIDRDRRNEDQMDSINQGIRTSSRLKRFPNTRSDDFLWV